MLIRKASDILSSEITAEKLFHNRRDFMRNASLVLAAGASGTILSGCGTPQDSETEEPGADASDPTPDVRRAPDEWTPYDAITTYNNFYEFGMDKASPAKEAHTLRPKPWNVKVEGMVHKPGDYAFDDLLKGLAVYERVYRMRCVEGWSMVIPWQGIQLKDLLEKMEPASQAQYVEFETLLDPEQMPAQRPPGVLSRLFMTGLDWPYVEGLRMDEAMHPLTLIATGLYGKALPNQNGAPLRLVVPWKYGFKGVKSIVRIRFTDTMPTSTWMQQAPNEYGFFANVNPTVDHPRWSQARETRIGEFFKRETLMFNGYAEEVAKLYDGMDLRKWY